MGIFCNNINDMRDKAVKLLEDIEANKLPSLPHVLVKLLQACRDDNICFDRLSAIISQDAALCTRVIKAANSPIYGRARHLNSLKHTLMFLGLNTIKSIAITASIKQFFSEYSDHKTSFLKTFWHHSLSCANIAQALAELTAYPYPEEAYIAGLLHDIGKLMLEPRMQDEYKNLQHGIHPADEILKSETEAFGMDHARLAAIMLEKWNMPDVICDAVRYHHADMENIQQAHQLAKLINFANLLSSEIPARDQGIVTNTGIGLFDLSDGIIHKLLMEAREKTRELAISMEIDIGNGETPQQGDDRLENDQAMQLQLAREIRDNALVNSSLNNISIESSEIFKSIQQSINLLFGINNSLFLQLDKSQQHLEPAEQQYIAETSLFDHLKIDVNTQNCVCECLSSQQITNTFDKQTAGRQNILQEQIAHGLKSQGLICLPMSCASQQYGVFILGSDQRNARKLLNNSQLLSIFTDNLATKIQQHINYQNKISHIANSNNAQFIQRAKEIIHETNNPLTVIRNYLQLLSAKLDSHDPAQEELKTIKQEIDRIANIILRCKDEPETDSPVLDEIDVNKILSELIDIYKSSLFATHHIRSKLRLDKQLGRVRADKNIIKQIITNLLKNAVEAMQNDGDITISTANININGKNNIEIRIEDSGPGIPNDIMKQLYKPVKSSKGSGHSGLGLSISKNLVDRTGGTISCRTSESGTVFSIQIPA